MLTLFITFTFFSSCILVSFALEFPIGDNTMIFKFSLYGFLKNQQYFAPFLILFFLEKGMSFAMIGLLVSFREICICILEVPTGAIADVSGRRKAMILSFIAYIVSFLIFSFCSSMWLFFPAMFFFAIGEAFRTGTHKAIIFDWLMHQNRADEKTTIYGYTRSWSKIGSAVSIPIAAAIIFFSGNYAYAFMISVIPYLLNIAMFFTYPNYLDRAKSTPENHSSVKAIFHTFFESIKHAVSNRKMRRLLLESMNYEGIFRTSKDYLQPILQTFAVSLAFLPALQEDKRTAIIIGIVYVILYLLSGLASRHTGIFAKYAGGEQKASRVLWLLNMLTFVCLGTGIYYQVNSIVIAAFIIIAILQNFWRPILISRCATLSNPDDTATMLSIESQAKTIFTSIMAPIMGWSIDYLCTVDNSMRFLPIAIMGFIVSAWMLMVKPIKN